jgi:predicted NodU family carbamoyl transferase
LYILGINGYDDDASAAITKDGLLIAASEEERFKRKKHCAGFPTAGIQYCIEAAQNNATELDHPGISRDRSAHLEKKILFSTRHFPSRSNVITSRLTSARRHLAAGFSGWSPRPDLLRAAINPLFPHQSNNVRDKMLREHHSVTRLAAVPFTTWM